MLFNLVLKDFVLAKKCLVLLVIIAVGAPIFVTATVKFSSGGFLEFIIAAFYMEHMLLGTVAVAEEKYKGSALLCTTPYTRNTLVKAKYIFSLVIFICTYIIYTITTFVVPIGIDRLNIFTFGMSLLFITIIWGIIIPTQYKFGYEKSKYISIAVFFISIFTLPNLIKRLVSESSRIQILFPQVVQNMLPFFLALFIGLISMIISIRIYSKKDL